MSKSRNILSGAERRTLAPGAARLRVQRADGEAVHIVGYGAVFYRAGEPGTEYQLWSDAVERISPGAFDRALAEDDVRSLFNHDENIVLGRNTAGTLSLSVDAVGLLYDVTAPDTQLVRDQVLAPIERGDVNGSSFMFVPRRSVWIEEVNDAGETLYIRDITDVELWEVGPVVFPAYAGTTTGVRGQVSPRSLECETARESFDAWRRTLAESAEKMAASARAVRTLARSLETLEREGA